MRPGRNCAVCGRTCGRPTAAADPGHDRGGCAAIGTPPRIAGCRLEYGPGCVAGLSAVIVYAGTGAFPELRLPMGDRRQELPPVSAQSAPPGEASNQISSRVSSQVLDARPSSRDAPEPSPLPGARPLPARGLLLVARNGDTLAKLYSKVYRRAAVLRESGDEPCPGAAGSPRHVPRAARRLAARCDEVPPGRDIPVGRPSASPRRPGCYAAGSRATAVRSKACNALRWSARRMARAHMVKVGFAAPEVGMTAPLATKQFSTSHSRRLPSTTP